MPRQPGYLQLPGVAIISRAFLRLPLHRADLMGMAAPIYWTKEMVLALPDDGNKYECVYGELLVSPAPRPWHEEIVTRLLIVLRAYVERERCGHCSAPARISHGATTRKLYQDVHIPLYWIVDTDAHEIEVWTPDVRFPSVERELVIWAPLGASQPLVIELAELFKPI